MNSNNAPDNIISVRATDALYEWIIKRSAEENQTESEFIEGILQNAMHDEAQKDKQIQKKVEPNYLKSTPSRTAMGFIKD